MGVVGQAAVPNRELVVLGTASQAPTRDRNHNGYLLRWDGDGLLFDPGEGTQRQMLLAGVKASEISHICITHFHGDHCLGLPGVLQRLSLDRVAHEVACHYPAEGQEYLGGCGTPPSSTTSPRSGAPGGPREDPGVDRRRPGEFPAVRRGTARRRVPADAALSHRVPIGYQLAEPDGRRMRPERLAAVGVSGPDVGLLARQGWLDVNGRRVHLAEVSEPRPGQRFAFIMDTRMCEAVVRARGGGGPDGLRSDVPGLSTRPSPPSTGT